jgi:hypothetical protein
VLCQNSNHKLSDVLMFVVNFDKQDRPKLSLNLAPAKF